MTGRWTIFVPGRPLAERHRPRRNAAEPRGFCPFCAGHESKTPGETLVVHREGRWRVRVVPNKFPALDPAASPAPSTRGLYDAAGGFGLHEVVIESPDHGEDFGDFSPEHAGDVVAAWQSRMAEIGKDPRVRYIMLFRNCGPEAGASLEHPHSQIIALPIFPRLVMQEIDFARRYFEWKDRCVFCDLVHEELTQGVRIIAESARFASFSPYAARFPYEIWIVPKRHEGHFARMTAEDRADFARVLRDTLRRLDLALDRPPFNLILHTTPCQEGDISHYHWHVEIMPRLTRVAGFEWGTGFYLNPVLPEDAVARLAAAGSSL